MAIPHGLSVKLDDRWSLKVTRKKKNKKQEASVKRPMIVIPYVEKVSEAIVRIMKKHNVPMPSMAVKPWKTLKDLLVHPKDKQDKEDIT